jgi:hypothetical protein
MIDAQSNLTLLWKRTISAVPSITTEIFTAQFRP